MHEITKHAAELVGIDPCKKGIFWLLIRLSKHNISVFGACQKQRQKENAKSDDQVIRSKGVSKQKSNLAKYLIRRGPRQQRLPGGKLLVHHKRSDQHRPGNL